MKKILYSLMSFLITLSFTSCNDETTQDLSVVTHYVTLELNGDELIHLPLGTTYTDEGVIALEGDEDVTSNVTVNNSVNSNEAGIYTVTYSVTNKDGFPSSTERTVIVYDPSINTSIEGVYNVNGTRNSSGKIEAYSGFTVSITNYLPGIFKISDYLGGYYEQGRGYGSAYALTGYLKINADNTIEALTGYVAGWGDSYNSVENGIYDAATGEISFDVDYAGMLFAVTLTK